jgi:polar amino acid transport system substrate-binding protein
MTQRIAAIFCLVFFVMNGTGLSREWTVITENRPPYNYIEKTRVTGSSVEVVRELLRRLGIKSKIQIMPWARGYTRLKEQRDVALFSTVFTPERKDLFRWVGPICRVTSGFYARRGSGVHPASLEDAAKVRRIATYREDVFESELRNLGFSNLESSNSPTSNLKKLISGRVDLWLHDNIGSSRIAEAIGVDPEAIEMVLPFRSYDLFIALSGETPLTVVAKWQAALDGMRRDGTLERISLKWLPAEALPGKTPAAPAPLKIYTENNPPGNYLDGGKPAGMAVDLVREILRRRGEPDTIQVVPWARGYSLALTEPNVALFSATRLPQREKLFHWVGPIYSQVWGFYGKKGSGIRITSLEEAKKVPRIGTYHKDAKKQFLESMGFKNLVSTNRNISNLRHLMAGDIDLWVSSNFNMPYLVRQAGIDPGQLELVYSFRRVDNYIVISLQTPETVAEAWQQALDEIRKDGTYLKLCKKIGYLPEPF